MSNLQIQAGYAFVSKKVIETAIKWMDPDNDYNHLSGEDYADILNCRENLEKALVISNPSSPIDLTVGDKFVRVKMFDSDRLFTVQEILGSGVIADDGLYYSKNPEWTRKPTKEELLANRRLKEVTPNGD